MFRVDVDTDKYISSYMSATNGARMHGARKMSFQGFMFALVAAIQCAQGVRSAHALVNPEKSYKIITGHARHIFTYSGMYSTRWAPSRMT